MTRWVIGIAAVMALAGVAVVLGQEGPAGDPPPPQATEDYMRPTDTGVRLTPGMARSLGRLLVRETLRGKYDLDEEAQKKAADRIARDMMKMAHKTENDGARFFEFAFETLMENHGRFTAESGRQWAEMSRPLLPFVKEFMTDAANDIRPLLPPGKQMQFAGDMMKASMGLDLYEKKMERWSQGKVNEHENPFDASDEAQPTTAESGESRQVREARHRAESSMKYESSGRWRQYVDSAIAYYKLDEGQKKSAESILREMEERAKQVQTDEWKAKMLLNRTRLNLSYRGLSLWNTPWAWQLEREYEDLLKPIKDLTRELQDRLETLPTEPQRQAAAARTSESFVKLGLKE